MIRPDLGFETKMTEMPKIAVIVDITVNPDRTEEFEAFVKNEYVPVVKKAKVGALWVSKLVFGGNTNRFTMIEPQANFAELDKGPPMSRVLKPAEVKAMMAKLPDGTIEAVEVTVGVLHPELSVMPATP
jgi:quinol monooxygenase YgiN